MNRKALYYAIAYSVLVMLVKLTVVMKGYYNTQFGFYYVHILTVFAIIPFVYLAIRHARDTDHGGFIGGRGAARIGLTVVAVSAILLTIYNYTEMRIFGRDMAAAYYNSEQFLDYLKNRTKADPAQYQKIIEEQIRQTENAAFKSSTVKLLPLMLIGLGAAFVSAQILKRKPGAGSPE